MIKIRRLTEEDMRQAVELKVLCWTEELAGKAENTLSVSKELDFWVEWMHSGKKYNDVRLLIGAFEEEQMLGVAFTSFAESSDISEKGIELNGLWVYPEHRGRGVSLMMIAYILDFYLNIGMEKMIVYNIHYSPSNQFYRKFGAQVIKQDNQMSGRLLVDVFLMDLLIMKRNIAHFLDKYIKDYDYIFQSK